MWERKGASRVGTARTQRSGGVWAKKGGTGGRACIAIVTQKRQVLILVTQQVMGRFGFSRLWPRVL